LPSTIHLKTEKVIASTDIQGSVTKDRIYIKKSFACWQICISMVDINNLY